MAYIIKGLYGGKEKEIESFDALVGTVLGDFCNCYDAGELSKEEFERNCAELLKSPELVTEFGYEIAQSNHLMRFDAQEVLDSFLEEYTVEEINEVKKAILALELGLKVVPDNDYFDGFCKDGLVDPLTATLIKMAVDGYDSRED